MKILEKILQEIEKKIETAQKIIIKPPCDILDEIANDTAEAFIEAYKECQEIIRSHTEDDEWIPVKPKGNPKENGTYLCTFIGELCGIDEPFTGMCGYEDGEWDEEGCVIAWMELPEPYRSEEHA